MRVVRHLNLHPLLKILFASLPPTADMGFHCLDNASGVAPHAYQFRMRARLRCV
jgi:hypothetical protein